MIGCDTEDNPLLAGFDSVLRVLVNDFDIDADIGEGGFTADLRTLLRELPLEEVLLPKELSGVGGRLAVLP